MTDTNANNNKPGPDVSGGQPKARRASKLRRLKSLFAYPGKVLKILILKIKKMRIPKKRLAQLGRRITSLWPVKFFVGFTKKHYRAIIIVLILIASHISVFAYGHARGIASDKNRIASSYQTQTKRLLETRSIPYRSLSGAVTNLKDNKLTIRTSDNREATFNLTDKTKYSQKSLSKTRSDLKVGNQVTVFALDTDSLNATQIVIAN